MEKGTEMKNKSKIFYFVLISLFIGNFSPIYDTNGQEGVYTSPTYSFEIDPNTNFTVVTKAPLKWKQYRSENVTVTIKTTGLAAGENLSLTLVSFLFNYPDDPLPHSSGAKVINQNLTAVDEEYEFNQTFTPQDPIQFNITIKVIANSTGVPTSQEFFAEFPGDEPYIEVEKSKAAPIINLPGFPDPQTFVRWIFIFMVAIVMISSPAIFVGVMKIKEITQNRKKKGEEKK